MNIYNPMSTLGKGIRPLDHPYKAVVVEVDTDPNYIGRIKVSIPELFGDYESSGDQNINGILPWIYPRFLGKFSGLVELGVPEKGEIVEVEFPYRNIYLGYYTNKPLFTTAWDKIKALGPEGEEIFKAFTGEHYPNVYGHIDSNLTGWYVDKVTNEIFLVQGGQKAKIWFDPEGSINVTSPKNLIFNAGESIIMNSGTSFELTTKTIAQGCTDYHLDTETMATKGEHSHTGKITSSDDQIAGGISTMNHTHEYQKPEHPAGPEQTAKPS